MTNSTLTCPKCKATEEFRYHEDQIVRVTKEVGEIIDGALQITRFAVQSEIDRAGQGEHPRLEWCACYHEFEIPAGLELDFVD